MLEKEVSCLLSNEVKKSVEEGRGGCFGARESSSRRVLLWQVLTWIMSFRGGLTNSLLLLMSKLQTAVHRGSSSHKRLATNYRVVSPLTIYSWVGIFNCTEDEVLDQIHAEPHPSCRF